jgi:hypothetical protein
VFGWGMSNAECRKIVIYFEGRHPELKKCVEGREVGTSLRTRERVRQCAAKDLLRYGSL